MTIDAFCSLVELGAALSAGHCSALELADIYLARIARADYLLHAYVEVDEASVRAQARASDLRRASGHTLGPLEGLPIAVKDLCEIEGRPFGCGSLAWAGRRSAQTAAIVMRLRRAGMVILGKTHMVEFAYGGWGTNHHLGTPRNPWDLRVHRIPGGSSSGSGVAVASGLAPAAIGSDTGGSVRIPAALVGITGLKTTAGLISRHGVMPLSGTLDTIGPMTRTATDAALLTEVLAGADLRDPSTLNAPRFASAQPSGPSDLAGMRILVLPDESSTSAVEPDVLLAFRRAKDVLRGLGASIREQPFPIDFSDLVRRNGVLTCAEAWSEFGALAEDPAAPLSDAVRARIRAGAAVSTADYIRALAHQREAAEQWHEWMRHADALLTPTLPLAACPLESVDEGAVPLATFTRVANYLGGCALSLPSGFSVDGLPVAVQLMGKRFDEATLLGIGQAYQEATHWHRCTPDLSALFPPS